MRAARARDAAFVAVNCAAFSRELVESELFGHEKGAFTGAVRAARAIRGGRRRHAVPRRDRRHAPGDPGQAAARASRKSSFERVGGNQPLAVDVRIIAATNQDLEAMVESGRFREDLYYRIKVVELRVPPLRERREDIPLLAMHFLEEACESFGAERKTLAPEAMRECVENPWRGNVRSLKAAIEQAVILSAGSEITAAESARAASRSQGQCAALASRPHADALTPAAHGSSRR